jgi:hypothetical protein
VKPPSLNTGSWNRLVVTIGTTIPVSSRNCGRLTGWSRRPAGPPGSIRIDEM